MEPLTYTSMMIVIGSFSSASISQVLTVKERKLDFDESLENHREIIDIEQHIPTARIVLCIILSIFLAGLLLRTYTVFKKYQLHIDERKKAPIGRVLVECGWCQCRQYAPMRGGPIFICCRCHCANRVPDIGHFKVPAGQILQFEFSWITATFFKIEHQRPLTHETPTIYGDPNSTEPRIVELPACHVCFDRPSDIILLPCAHGGLCEKCAIKIAQDWSNEPKCPQCRQNMETLVKLEDVSDDRRLVTGTEFRIPMVCYDSEERV